MTPEKEALVAKLQHDVDDFTRSAHVSISKATLREAIDALAALPDAPDRIIGVTEPAAYLMTPNALSHPELKPDVTFKKPPNRPDWIITPLVRIAALNEAYAEGRKDEAEDTANRGRECTAADLVAIDASPDAPPLLTASRIEELFWQAGTGIEPNPDWFLSADEKFARLVESEVRRQFGMKT